MTEAEKAKYHYISKVFHFLEEYREKNLAYGDKMSIKESEIANKIIDDIEDELDKLWEDNIKII